MDNVEPASMSQRDLRRVTKCAEALERARENMFDAILAARDSGESLRDIAQAAGLSHQRVHQITSERKGKP